MKKIIYVGFVILAVLGLSFGQSKTNTKQPPTKQQDQKPKFTETSPELERRDQPVDNKDLLILKRAGEILSDEAKWNRNDDRTCRPDDKAWSLFCALEKASIELLGEYQHRRAAIQEVRFVIEDVTNGKEFEHRLMDYNNLPSTRFEDIKKVLKMAADRVSARLKEKK